MARKIKLNWETEPRTRHGSRYIDAFYQHRIVDDGGAGDRIRARNRARNRYGVPRKKKTTKIRKFLNWVQEKTKKTMPLKSEAQSENIKNPFYDEIYGLNPLEWNREYEQPQEEVAPESNRPSEAAKRLSNRYIVRENDFTDNSVQNNAEVQPSYTQPACYKYYKSKRQRDEDSHIKKSEDDYVRKRDRDAYIEKLKKDLGLI